MLFSTKVNTIIFFSLQVHRHHLGLCWPLPDTYMNSKPVIINMNLNLNNYDCAFDNQSLFNQFSKIDKQKFAIQKSLEQIQELQESLMNKYFGE